MVEAIQNFMNTPVGNKTLGDVWFLFLILGLCLVGLVALLLQLVFRLITAPRKHRAEKQRLASLGILQITYGTHRFGLPVPKNVKCTIYQYTDCLKFVYKQMEVTLPNHKILDVTMREDTHTETHYVSDVGKAVYWAMKNEPKLAGWLGRARKVKDVYYSDYLVITYMNESTIATIELNVTKNPRIAKKIADSYAKPESEINPGKTEIYL